MKTLVNTFVLLSSLLALQGCCMGSGSTESPPVEGASTVAPPAPGGGLTVGGPPLGVEVPALPGGSLTVAAPGEFQIDATSTTNDAQLWLVQNGSVITQDSDSGEGTNARIVAFLAPGTYDIQVGEWQSRDLDAQLSVTQLGPMTAVATIAPGAPPATVQTPAGTSPREGSVEITLTIAAAGTYRIDAVCPGGALDPEMQLIQNGGLLQADSDSGEGTSAQIVRALEPGSYTIRVRDWINRAGAIDVSVTPA